MAGEGKTVALKGLGRDRQVREAFDEIHYITLDHEATANTVASELARIVERSGGKRHSSGVLSCKDVSAAVLQTSHWFLVASVCFSLMMCGRLVTTTMDVYQL